MNLEKLVFDFGDPSFTKEEFAKEIAPFMDDLKKVKRTNYLFVALYGDGSKPAVTGYRTNNTINVTINQYATKAERTGGKWAVYQYSG